MAGGTALPLLSLRLDAKMLAIGGTHSPTCFVQARTASFFLALVQLIPDFSE